MEEFSAGGAGPGCAGWGWWAELEEGVESRAAVWLLQLPAAGGGTLGPHQEPD